MVEENEVKQVMEICVFSKFNKEFLLNSGKQIWGFKRKRDHQWKIDLLINRENNRKKKFKGKFIEGKVSHSFWRNFFVLRHVNGVVSGKTSAMHNL